MFIFIVQKLFYFSDTKQIIMSPKIPVADDHIIPMYEMNLIIKHLYPDCCISSANNFDTSFYTLASYENNVSIQSTIVPSIPDF
jgi:hypothetical protein